MDEAAERLRILPSAVSNIQRPRHAQWESLFCLQDGPALPLQQRLRLSVVQAILDGRLPMGAPLPSSRELAKVLGLSRNTVTAAYVQLVDDGFLDARPRSGVFVTMNARTTEVRQNEPGRQGAKPTGLRADLLGSKCWHTAH